MPKDALDVGTIVRLPVAAAGARQRLGHDGHARAEHAHVEYRIEQLLQLDGGGVLYKVKTDSEPFDRIVEARDLAPAREPCEI